VEGNLSDPLNSGAVFQLTSRENVRQKIFSKTLTPLGCTRSPNFGVHYATVSRRLKQLKIRVRMRAE
jgi:hypothetical protein